MIWMCLMGKGQPAEHARRGIAKAPGDKAVGNLMTDNGQHTRHEHDRELKRKFSMGILWVFINRRVFLTDWRGKVI